MTSAVIQSKQNNSVAKESIQTLWRDKVEAKLGRGLRFVKLTLLTNQI